MSSDDEPTNPGRPTAIWAGATADALQRLVAWCVDQVGKPVLWDAKGDYFYDVDGKKVTFPPGVHAFDCSGLITAGVKACGGPDLRDTHNAQRIWNEAPPVELADPPPLGALGFYGQDANHINHVVLAMNGHLISADGATHTIRTLAAATQSGAQVRVHQRYDFRRDEPFWGWRMNSLFDTKQGG